MADTASTSSPALVRDPRRALIAAGVVAGVLLIEFLATYLESFAGGPQGPQYLVGIVVPAVFAGILPKAAGIFLVLWLWPARLDERILVLLARALVAALAGCVAAAIVSVVYTVVLSGLRFADYGAFGYNPFSGIVSATVGLAPVVMLVVLIQRLLARGARL